MTVAGVAYLTREWRLPACTGNTPPSWIVFVSKLPTFKVEYLADAKYENPLNNSEKIACVGPR